MYFRQTNLWALSIYLSTCIYSIYHGKLQNPLNTCCMGVCIYLVGGACSEKGVWWLWVEGVCWTGVSALVVRSNPPHHRCLCWRVQEEGIPVSLQMKRKKERNKEIKWVIEGTLIKIKKTSSIHPSKVPVALPSFLHSLILSPNRDHETREKLTPFPLAHLSQSNS